MPELQELVQKSSTKKGKKKVTKNKQTKLSHLFKKGNDSTNDDDDDDPINDDNDSNDADNDSDEDC